MGERDVQDGDTGFLSARLPAEDVFREVLGAAWPMSSSSVANRAATPMSSDVAQAGTFQLVATGRLLAIPRVDRAIIAGDVHTAFATRVVSDADR